MRWGAGAARAEGATEAAATAAGSEAAATEAAARGAARAEEAREVAVRAAGSAGARAEEATEVAAMVAGSAGAETEAAACQAAAWGVAKAAGVKVARGAAPEIRARWGAAEGQAEMRVAVVQGVVKVAGTAALGG